METRITIREKLYTGYYLPIGMSYPYFVFTEDGKIYDTPSMKIYLALKTGGEFKIDLSKSATTHSDGTIVKMWRLGNEVV
jgi:hypothetical protein